ncbi:MAG: ATP-binding cassette domain-containing protein [Deltaproteobacteria bacterium]|nr:ATP-binding cassette domain-containing protein [Deltaproteobacteria bacterium]
MTQHHPTDEILCCNQLAVGYGNKAIVSGINLRIRAGHFISLLGPNGTGKTTLLRTLSGHLAPLSGSIQLNRHPLSALSPAALARLMAVVLTDKVSPPLLSVFDFVALGRYPHTNFLGRLTARDRKVVLESLDAVHAGELVRREFANLSDGEKQKILIARALAQEPRVLLLDEPTAHLDLKHRIEVMAILRSLCRSQGITIIASLHDVDIAAKVSDQVALLKDGAITAWGFPEDVLTGDAVTALYDFDSACFSHQLGSIELRGDGHLERVFVVAGAGSGAAVYRMLAKRGYNITTGVLHSNDLDCYVGRSLGADCTTQPPASGMSETALRRAITKLGDCRWVIDAGFDLVGPYRGNLELLQQAAAMGKTVFSLREQSLQLAAPAKTGSLAFGSLNQLLNRMEDQR